ncbi:MAG: glycosyltransferase family 9 protein [Verrucomicrobia bacterium]|jgi:ADP-heptose:LPS heptosyltransferase|nr:glycosyltransferase family 9 protein [Verrucomicrobiota bacterium]
MSPGSTPTFKDLTVTARKVLVVDFGFLGDSVQLIPALWELRRHQPQSELHVLTSRVGGEVLRMAPCVDRVWDLELMPDRRTLREQLRVLRGLRREHFDAAFNFSGSDRTIFWTWFTGARQRATNTWGRPHFWTRWLIPHIAPQPDPDLPVAQQHERMLRTLGFECGARRYELSPDAAARKRADSLVPPGAVHLSINAAKPLKEWPLEHSIELGRRLLARSPECRIVASGSAQPREQQRLRQLADAVDNSRLQVLPSDLSIPQLAAVLQRCRLHIGPDSGVMNLAAALGLPTVSFFRDQPGYKSWLPAGTAHRTFIGQCHCVDHGHAPCLPSERAACLAAIPPETALSAVLELLSHPG